MSCWRRRAFTRGGVLLTARRLGLHSEASHRFERGTDPEGLDRGAARGAALIAAWTGAEVLTGVAGAARRPGRRWVSCPAVAGEPSARVRGHGRGRRRGVRHAGDGPARDGGGPRRGGGPRLPRRYRARGRPDRGGRPRPGVRPRRIDPAAGAARRRRPRDVRAGAPGEGAARARGPPRDPPGAVRVPGGPRPVRGHRRDRRSRTRSGPRSPGSGRGSRPGSCARWRATRSAGAAIVALFEVGTTFRLRGVPSPSTARRGSCCRGTPPRAGTPRPATWTSSTPRGCSPRSSTGSAWRPGRSGTSPPGRSTRAAPHRSCSATGRSVSSARSTRGWPPTWGSTGG